MASPERIRACAESLLPRTELESGRSIDPIVAGAAQWFHLDARQTEQVRTTARKWIEGAPLMPADLDCLEAILLPKERPVADLAGGKLLGLPQGEFFDLYADTALRGRIEACLPAIGRIELPGNLSLPYGGAGFVVGDGLVMTNRHVAQLFASGVGRNALRFLPGQTAAFDPRHERPDEPAGPIYALSRVVMIHPYWDMALLGVDGLRVAPLELATDDVPARRRVVVVGYPGFDPRNDVEVQQRVFRGRYNLKRLAPGYFGGRRRVASFGRTVSAALHDASTLGACSGAAIVDVATGRVLGLHFGGVYLDRNFAVPAAELAWDSRVVDAGVKFAGRPAARPLPREWSAAWSDVEEVLPPAQSPGEVPRMAVAGSEQTLSLTVPIEITVRIGPAGPHGATIAAGPTTEPTIVVRPELRQLVAAARARRYYDAGQDAVDRDKYYADVLHDVSYESLSALVAATHLETPSYDPSRHLYPWVDLRPDRRLASIYSNVTFTPEELIAADARIDAARRARRAEALAWRSFESPAALAELEAAIEAELPYNCEHVVPQSWFRKREPMRGDLHHLFACDHHCNQLRANRSYFEFARDEPLPPCGEGEGPHFEPANGRGPVARATLYFLVRYPGEIDAPHELQPAQLELLTRWSKEEPPGQYERHRNQAIFAVQGNRNPFVDYPQWVDLVDFTPGLGVP
ncbi:endonuclease [Nannocystis punicea]|uniref:Endonuclease n=1 Tax=Nannocystis punicea TaxID=2995304 RepID=A0ABY7HJS0_9BACT|nr:endonuclease [Nannocystis poenicansa]WAS99280.1 endonuclease [Nannocystis poenicansa]